MWACRSRKQGCAGEGLPEEGLGKGAPGPGGPGQARPGSRKGACRVIYRRRWLAGRECPSLSSPAARPTFALVHSRRIPPPRPALPLQPNECLLTHPEKASIMARRLPPPEEFRGAGPTGRQGADGPRRLPIGWPAVLDSPARLVSHRLTSLPTAAPGRGSEVAFAPA